jgi:eukaryotic-like serine/threonine-protein kinase
MAGITTNDDLLATVRKSGLVEEERLNAFLQKFTDDNPLPSKPNVLAGRMVREGLVTKFQAQQLLMGKTKGYVIAGKYKLQELLGVGGMGKVFLCEHTRMRRLVAVKILPTDQIKNTEAVERFYREAQASAALDHPNIVRAYDIDQDGRVHFLVMEYVDGASLQDIVKEHGPLDVPRACHYVAQAAAGLEHAREVGMVHRDIKPGNLLLDRTGTVKILDMGLARFFRDQGDALTKKYEQQSFLGTIDYLAPEQALDSHDVDIRADIYSLGATFYFLLTGQNPFAGTTAEKLVRHQMRDPKPITQLRPEVPEKLAAIVSKMMAKKPEKRYQTPLEVIEALEPWTATPIPPPSEEEMPPRNAALAASSPSSSSSTPSGGSRTAIRRSGTSPSSRKVRRPKSALELVREKPVLVGGVAAGALLVVAGLAWWLLGGGSSRQVASTQTQPGTASSGAAATGTKGSQQGAARPAEPEKLPPSSGHRLLVTHDPQRRAAEKGQVFASVKEALQKAQPGDEVHVLDDRIDEALSLDDGQAGKGVTLTGLAGDRRTRWVPGKDHPADAPLLRVKSVPGFRVQGFIFDGQTRVRELLEVSGDCPGVRVDGVELTNFTDRAVTLTSCRGSQDAPVELSRLRLVIDWKGKRTTGLVLASEPQGNSALTNEHLSIRDSRFEGPFHALVELQGPALEVEFIRNRAFAAKDSDIPTWVTMGVVYKKAQPPHPVRLTFAHNTLCRLDSCLLLEALPPSAGDSRFVVRDNLINGAQALVSFDGMKVDPEQAKALFPEYGGNVTRPPGTAYCPKQPSWLPLVRVAYPYLDVSQIDDSKFLRYKKTDPQATAGTNGGPAGVPPLE